ncbi:putative bifunctional diguanylate cyclase/phosphodiesterase [Methylophaga sp.]|uniref:putative bifunctional diguanylate cyclase/phosphodiesterase n=1 Tax=Methylophaga sp. TaxID=2024840 RepID=UPI003F6A45E9
MSKFSSKSIKNRAAINTFVSALLTGAVGLIIPIYLQSELNSDTSFIRELLLFYGLALPVIPFLAGLFAYLTYRALSKPLEDIQQISHALPFISAQKYDDAKLIFQRIDKETRLQEVAELQSASLELARVLEQVDATSVKRRQLIHKTNEDLRKERDFIKNLLDTAQLIILTIDSKFVVTMFNEHAEKLTGYPEKEVLGTDVSRFFPAGSWDDAQTFFHELFDGNINIAQQDAELIDKDGHIRNISWLHSKLHSDNGDPSLLSVGLDMTEKKEAEKRIVWLAEHDPLTNLCNRRKFTEEFEKSLRTAIRYKHNNALLFLDLDQFKDINDTSGHAAGDELLIHVSKTLKQVIRFTDLVARLGGDEFAILLPETDLHGAKTLASKIINELSKIQLEFGAFRHKVSTSIGIVDYPLLDADIHELMGYADLAMYKAKSRGKGTYHIFSADDQTREQLESRVFWKQQIEQALEEKLFIPHFQPILNISDSTISHYEVLIRMKNPQNGEMRAPARFIQVAEEVGLIQNIDHYVIEESIYHLARLQQQGKNIKLAINLSGAVVDAPVLLPLLKKLIKASHVDPTGLIFEVTETAAVSNFQQAKLMMTAVKALGCQFSLDDFGVGFASFNYMRELPVDIIKIDGIFIKDLDKNAHDQLFVKALVDVAKGLGKKVIAEFVENQNVLDILKSYKVDYAQGYHIGRPEAQVLRDTDWTPSVDLEPYIKIEK